MEDPQSSPWLSILKCSNFGWFVVPPHFGKPPFLGAKLSLFSSWQYIPVYIYIYMYIYIYYIYIPIFFLTAITIAIQFWGSCWPTPRRIPSCGHGIHVARGFHHGLQVTPQPCEKMGIWTKMWSEWDIYRIIIWGYNGDFSVSNGSKWAHHWDCGGYYT